MGAPVMVRQFRQILLWPLQLMPPAEGASARPPWEALAADTPDSPWQRHADELCADPAGFGERHYSEFTTFLPYVQRLLYGEGRAAGTDPATAGASPIRIYRRRDVAQARLSFPGVPPQTLLLAIDHVDLLFFQGMDVVVLVLELHGGPLPLPRLQDLLHRFGRAYPTHWTEAGAPGHCLQRAEWLAADGTLLAASDYELRELYLRHVCQYRAPCLSAHWEFLLRPLVPHHSDEPGAVRWRLVEYHRMPLMAWLAVDEPARLTRADFVRLALVTAPGPPALLPLPEAELADFERRYCADRYWQERSDGSAGARYLCSGESFVLVGNAADRYFTDPERGLLGQFRHQYFLLFLLPHFHKAALFMLSDRLVDAINHLDVTDSGSVARFKRKIRKLKQTLLGFTHGYWFQQVSDQPLAKQLYRMCQAWLDNERSYDEVREEIGEMLDYLDSDALRRQASSAMRLTVVTLFGLIGTISTGFLGMNLLAAAETSLGYRIGLFALVFVPTLWLTFYTIAKSQRLSDFLDALADERLPRRAKLAALLRVWQRPRR